MGVEDTEAEIARAAAISFHRIIQFGEIAKVPVSPNPSLLKALAIFLSILFSALGIYLVSAIRGSIGDESLVYKNSDNKVLKSIPYLKDAEKLDDYFKKWIIELDFNSTLKQHDSISISSMKMYEGKRSVALGMAQAAAELGKKVLYISMDNRALPVSNKINFININTTVSNWQLPSVFDALLLKWKSDYDLVFIQNVDFKDNANSLLALRSSDLNLFVLDSRLSKLNYITEVDDVVQKMNLSNFYYIVNRGGYSPSIFSKVKNIFKWSKQIKNTK